MLKYILLDVDGVLADFGRACADLFQVDYDSLPNDGDGAYRFYDMLGISEEEFWKGLSKAGSGLWENIPTLPAARELYEMCAEVAPTFICTAYTKDADCASGKIRWLRKFFGVKDVDNLVLTRHKYLLAASDKVLIDDATYNIDQFRAAGGHGILYPCLWNENKDWFYRRNYYVREYLRHLNKGAENAYLLGY